MMRNLLKVSAALSAIICICSCSKEGAQLFRGNYSFKTSGSMEVHVSGTYTDSFDNTTDIDEQLSVDLATEQGQMDIISTSGKDGQMVVTMNVLAGDVYTADAQAPGDVLTLTPFERKVNVRVRNNNVSVPISVNGTARRYSDTVIYEFSYTGKTDIDTDGLKLHLEIVESDVRCVAKLNK